MKYVVTEWYEDCLCPSGDNDHVIRSEEIVASSAQEAEQVYRNRHDVDWNNVLKTAQVHERRQ